MPREGGNWDFYKKSGDGTLLGTCSGKSRCCLLPFGRVRVASRRYIGAIDLGSALVPVENDTFVLEHAKEERSRIPQRFILNSYSREC